MFEKFGDFIVLDPDPHSLILVDPDPHTINADPHPWLNNSTAQPRISDVLLTDISYCAI